MKDIKDLVSILKPKTILGNVEGFISSVCYNSSKCIPNSLFVAISGTKVDGHYFIEDALNRGAKYIICEQLPNNLSKDCTYFLVENSRIALAKTSNFWFDFPTKNMCVVGVTGTNGKTTVTYLLKEIMKTSGKKSGVIGTIGAFSDGYSKSLNNTTPESYELFNILKELNDIGVEFVAIEVSSHSLHQNRVYGINFSGGIFTNLTQDHLDYHKTMEEYAQAKSLLFKSLNENSIAVGFNDDPYVGKVLHGTMAGKVILVGRNPISDVVILNENLGLDSSEFDLIFNSSVADVNGIHLKSKLVGRFNIENLALSTTLALAFEVDLETIQKVISSFRGVYGRMQKIRLKNGAIGIVDYAHTPDALQKALETCKEILNLNNINGKLICVFGCGGERDPHKRPIMGKIASEISDFVVLTNDNPRNENPDDILNQIFSGIASDKKKKVFQIQDREQAIEHAYNLSKENDIILVAGKGHEDYQIIGEIKYHFSDFEQLIKFGVS